MGGVTLNVQVAATDREPVLYDNLYLVQYLLDIKAKFMPLLNCRSLIKQNSDYQQALFRGFQEAWNRITTHRTQILIIIALARNKGCTNLKRRGIFVKKKSEILFTWPAKAMQNNFRVFGRTCFL